MSAPYQFTKSNIEFPLHFIFAYSSVSDGFMS